MTDQSPIPRSTTPRSSTAPSAASPEAATPWAPGEAMQRERRASEPMSRLSGEHVSAILMGPPMPPEEILEQIGLLEAMVRSASPVDETAQTALERRWLAALSRFPGEAVLRAMARWSDHWMPTPAELTARIEAIMTEARNVIFEQTIAAEQERLGRALEPAEKGAIAVRMSRRTGP